MHEYAPFAVTLLVILAGILLNRNDTKDLRAEIGSLRSEMNSKLTKIQDDLNSFHRSLGQHDKAIEILEKRQES
jgi:cell division protein FtsL